MKCEKCGHDPDVELNEEHMRAALIDVELTVGGPFVLNDEQWDEFVAYMTADHVPDPQWAEVAKRMQEYREAKARHASERTVPCPHRDSHDGLPCVVCGQTASHSSWEASK